MDAEREHAALFHFFINCTEMLLFN